MGSCVSVHKDQQAAVSIWSKDEKILIQSPVKEKPDTVNGGDHTVADVAVKSQRFSVAGSKDEAFFESQPWLDSDCEDDFVSVNGDFTPSCGNTPVHPILSSRTLLVTKPSVEEPLASTTDPSSPPDKKKRLSELFRESLRADDNADVDPDTNGHAKSPDGTASYYSRATSGRSSEKSPNRAMEKQLKSPQCCFPGLISSRSFNERKKKTAIEV